MSVIDEFLSGEVGVFCQTQVEATALLEWLCYKTGYYYSSSRFRIFGAGAIYLFDKCKRLIVIDRSYADSFAMSVVEYSGIISWEEELNVIEFL